VPLLRSFETRNRAHSKQGLPLRGRLFPHSIQSTITSSRLTLHSGHLWFFAERVAILFKVQKSNDPRSNNRIINAPDPRCARILNFLFPGGLFTAFTFPSSPCSGSNPGSSLCSDPEFSVSRGIVHCVHFPFFSVQWIKSRILAVLGS
jgi:hypothetical protein